MSESLQAVAKRLVRQLAERLAANDGKALMKLTTELEIALEDERMGQAATPRTLATLRATRLP